MPILAQEPAAFPPDLLDSMETFRSRDDFTPRAWWVLQTKSRQEKALARDLCEAQIHFYLPLTAQEHLIRGRVKHSYVPVISGYLFLLGDDDERVQSLKTNRVARVLPVHQQDILEHDLRNLAALIATGAPLTIEKRLCPGQRVRVKKGALAGLEGLIVQRRGTNRLLVAVTYLQQGVSVEIGDFMVEPIG